MLPIKDIRLTPDLIENSIKSKGFTGSIKDVIKLDNDFRNITQELEVKRAKKNKVSEQVAVDKRAGLNSEININDMQILGKEIKLLEDKLGSVKIDLNNLLMQLPNIPHSSVPKGSGEEDNIVVREWGIIPKTKFKKKTHLDLSKSLNIIDFERGSKISGSGFPLYVNKGAELERKIINSMIEHHVNNFNFIEIFPPVLMNEDSMSMTGQLPKFKDDMYYTDKDDLYLAPTAEVPVTNIHRDEIILEKDLPINYVAYSPCFRRESGSYGKDTRGLLRLHQFNKVEMVKFVKPEDSYIALEEITKQAESILQLLGLPYRVIELCTGDLSFSAAKCYDIEVWSPAEEKWLEVSSCSNFESFQSRRGKIRYRKQKDKKVDFIHTLNGSGLATPRLIVALLETYQTDDGKIIFPDSVADFIGLKEII